MKGLIILGLALISNVFAQTAPNDAAVGGELELNIFSHRNTHILPVTLNVSKYLSPGEGRDLDEFTIEEVEVALARVSGADIYADAIGSSGLIATGGLGFLSLKRKQFIFKGERAQYNLLNFVDASVGAIASIGGEFFIQVDLFVDLAAKRSFENDQLFKISAQEFEDYLASSDCVNCSNGELIDGREENATILDYKQLFPRYGAGIKMRYRRLKLSLYKEHYTTNYLSGVLVANDEGRYHYDKRILGKSVLVTELKLEFAYEAIRSNHLSLDVFASYAITAITSTTKSHFETEVLQASGEYEFETDVRPVATGGLDDRSVLRGGLRIKIN